MSAPRPPVFSESIESVYASELLALVSFETSRKANLRVIEGYRVWVKGLIESNKGEVAATAKQILQLEEKLHPYLHDGMGEELPAILAAYGFLLKDFHAAEAEPDRLKDDLSVLKATSNFIANLN